LDYILRPTAINLYVILANTQIIINL
jgi:hypothetical protein